MSEYTDDLAAIFLEGKEAEFFRSKEELIIKIKKYLNDDMKRIKISVSGYKSVVQNGHDIISRMKKVYSDIVELKKKVK